MKIVSADNAEALANIIEAVIDVVLDGAGMAVKGDDHLEWRQGYTAMSYRLLLELFDVAKKEASDYPDLAEMFGSQQHTALIEMLRLALTMATPDGIEVG